MAAMESEHAAAVVALEQIDTTSVEALAGLKREHEGVSELIEKASQRKDKVAAAVYVKVMEDYQARLRALDEKARPLREHARAELARLVVLHAKLKAAGEASQLEQQEIEFRFELGELSKEDFERRQQKAKEEVEARQKSFARADGLRQRFEDVLPPVLEPPAPKPAAVAPAAAGPSAVARAGAPSVQVGGERPLADSGVSAPTMPPVRLPVEPALRVPSPVAVEPPESTVVISPAVPPKDLKPSAPAPTDRLRTVAASRPRLVGEPGGKVYEVESGTTIGRTPDNGIALDVREVSRRHARIERQADGSFTLIDMGSGNGTYVNEQRVKEHKLQHGDRVRLGSELLIFHKE